MQNGFSIRRVDERKAAARILPLRKKRVWTARIASAISWTLQKRRELGWMRSFGVLVLAGFSVFVLYFVFLLITLPSIDEQTILAAAQSTAVTDREGVELYRIHGEEDRTLIPAEDIPDTLKKATIAIEDKRFYDRGCIDIRALLRAVFRFGQAGGASTITRQLARNALNLQRENILSRKIKELILGCQLEGRYEKSDLLALYLNWIPFGQNAYGAEQASRRYFGIGAKELSLAQSAVLASLPQRPTYFSPYGRHVHTEVPETLRAQIRDGEITSIDQISDNDVVIGLLGTTVGSGSTSLYIGGRADQVLSSMQEQAFITEEERKEATDELKTMEFKKTREDIRAPHFVLWAKEQVETMFKDSPEEELLEQGGLNIQTTLDWKLQEIAEDVIAKHRDNAQKVYMANNIALVAMDPATREILAYVGNTDYSDATKEGKIDMAQAPRQPGSSFKPFVYAAAFRRGYGPGTILWDVPTTFGDYQPQNFEGSFWGLMSARRALGASRNIPAVKAYFLAGEEDAILDLTAEMGAPTPQSLKPEQGYGAALGIGAAEVPLLEMVQGYATLAHGGKYLPVKAISRVTDRHGALLAMPEPEDDAGILGGTEGEQVLDARVAYEVTSILSDQGARPNEYWKTVLSVPGVQAAAKTGTSNKCLEREERPELANPDLAPCKKRRPDNVWTMGYTPDLVVGVWVGNATSEALSEKADGLTVAAPIWKDFMVRAQKVRPARSTAFAVPDGILQAQISQLSGELPTECTPVQLRRSDIFLSENAPTKDDPACIQLEVDRVTGLLASDECPAEAREVQSFLMPYNAAGKSFPQWDNDVVEWAKRQGARSGSGLQLFIAGSGGALPLPLAPRDKCTLKLTPGRTVRPSLTIVAPEEGGGASFPTLKPRISYTVGSSVRQIEYSIDGKVITTVVTEPFAPVLRVPATIDRSGTHTLRVTLTDNYYNVATDEVRFTFSLDSSGPDIRITSPAPGMELTAGSPLSIRAQSNDPEGDVKYVEFYLNSLLLSRDATSPYELTYTPKIDPGTYTVRAVATDLAGNTGEDEITITVH